MEVLEGTVSAQELIAYLERDRYLTIAQTAEYLSLSERSIRRHLDTLPHFRFGNKLLFKRSELDRWLERYRIRELEEEKYLNLRRIADEALAAVLGE